MPSALNIAQTDLLSPERLSEIQSQLRDIHPGPDLALAGDPRLLALGWLLISLLALCLIGALGLALWRQRHWARQIRWQDPELVPSVQAALREAAIRRWPETRSLQGEAWLAWLDEKGGSHFGEFAAHWPRWLYGQGEPDEGQRVRLHRAYLRWGRRCVVMPRLPAPGLSMGKPRRGGHRP